MKRYNVANRDETGYYSSGFDTWHEANDLLSLAKTHDPNAHIVELEVMTEVERLQAELEKVKRDRDAAMNDIAHICHTCNKKRCIGCKQCSNWVWRGPCAENGGAE